MNHLEQQAVDYYDKGIPSSLPDNNPYKIYAENHRWGRHHDHKSKDCPVCKRDGGK
jgi:hypothetical protein